MSLPRDTHVEVQLEIGHRALPKARETPDGYTHDWTVFVRGIGDWDIQHFVEKVVFNLHESFPKPKRVIKEPPYEVSESGYATFEFPIDVYFKNKDEPKMISFEYDLLLRTNVPVNKTRIEKLTFQNPSNDFKKKLLRAGGITSESATSGKLSSPDEKTSCTSSVPVSSASKTTKSNTSEVNNKKTSKPSSSSNSNPLITKEKSSNGSTISSTQHSHSHQHTLSISQHTPSSTSNISSITNDKPIIQPDSQFTDLFGIPIQRTSDSSVNKNKEISLKNKAPIGSKGSEFNKLSNNNSSKTSMNRNESDKTHKSNNEVKSTSKDRDKSGKETPKGKSDKNEPQSGKHKKKSTPSVASPAPSSTHEGIKKGKEVKAPSSSKKRKRSTCSDASSNAYNSNNESFKKDVSPNSIKSSDGKKDIKKQKVSSKDIVNSSGSKKESSTSTKISIITDKNTSSALSIEITKVKKEKTWDNEMKKSAKSSDSKSARDNSKSGIISGKGKVKEENASSSASSVKSTKKATSNKNVNVPTKDAAKHLNERETSSSPSSVSGSLTPGGVRVGMTNTSMHNNYSAMISDVDQESLSPFMSDPASPFDVHNNHNRVRRAISDGDGDSDSVGYNSNITPRLLDSQSRSLYANQSSNKNIHRKSNAMDKNNSYGDKRYSSTIYNELMDLQRRINDCTDGELLQRIVDVIEEAGVFVITDSTFDFDLMKVDENTLKKVKACFK